MLIIYAIAFVILVFLSAFFSSSETSILSLNRIRLEHKAKKNHKKAVIIKRVLKKPDDFFSMILLGNNLVNIAAASITTLIISKFLQLGDDLTLVVSTIFTTIIILFFAEIIPKTYAFRYSEKMAYSYAYPIKILSFLFSPFVYIITKISNLFVPKKKPKDIGKRLTIEEVKYFLKTEIEVFKYNPDVLKMVNEIIDFSTRDIKGVMTTRTDIIAIEEHSEYAELKDIIINKSISRIPVYRENLDNIIGVITLKEILNEIVRKDINKIKITDIMIMPIYVSEYSSINYVLEEFKKSKNDIAIVLDEYGVTIGLLTISDIFKEILGEIEFEKKNIEQISDSSFFINGSCPVDELKNRFELDLKESKDYTTISGLFIYYYGKFPKKNDKIKIDNFILKIEIMGENKIEKLKLVINEEGKEERYYK